MYYDILYNTKVGRAEGPGFGVIYHTVLYYIVVHYIIRYQDRPSGGSGERQPMQNCKISILVVVRDTVYIIPYGNMLYYTITRLAEWRVRGAATTPENCKISILEVVNYAVLYYTMLYWTILYNTKVGRAKGPGRRQPSDKLQDFNSGSCKLYCILLYHIILY